MQPSLISRSNVRSRVQRKGSLADSGQRSRGTPLEGCRTSLQDGIIEAQFLVQGKLKSAKEDAEAAEQNLKAKHKQTVTEVRLKGGGPSRLWRSDVSQSC